MNWNLWGRFLLWGSGVNAGVAFCCGVDGDMVALIACGVVAVVVGIFGLLYLGLAQTQAQKEAPDAEGTAARPD